MVLWLFTEQKYALREIKQRLEVEGDALFEIPPGNLDLISRLFITNLYQL